MVCGVHSISHLSKQEKPPETLGFRGPAHPFGPMGPAPTHPRMAAGLRLLLPRRGWGGSKVWISER